MIIIFKKIKSDCFECIYLCFLLIFFPIRFMSEEEKRAQRDSLKCSDSVAVHGAIVVRRAILNSLVAVVFSGLLGYVAAIGMRGMGRCATVVTINWLQACSALLLLWATIFVRGWEVQSFKGTSLAEKINQFFYRALCFIGTFLVIYSISFDLCTG